MTLVTTQYTPSPLRALYVMRPKKASGLRDIRGSELGFSEIGLALARNPRYPKPPPRACSAVGNAPQKRQVVCEPQESQREREVFAGDVRIGPSPFAPLVRASRSVTRGAIAATPQRPKRVREAHRGVIGHRAAVHNLALRGRRLLFECASGCPLASARVGHARCPPPRR